jgi:hypothetical protein
MSTQDAAASAATVTGQTPGDPAAVAVKLVEIAKQVAASIKTLGLHGKGVPGAKKRCSTILKSANTGKQLKAAGELAAGLRKGNAEAEKLAAAIEDALQPKQAVKSTERSDAAAVTAAPVPAAATKVEVRRIETAKIKMVELFSSLFAARPATVKGIEDDMRKYGFDAAHPVVIREEDGTLIDGHCRVHAAQQAGIAEVPAVFRHFADEDEALDYAIQTQRDRRNLTDADILCLVEQLDKRRARGGDRRSRQAKTNVPTGATERSSEDTAARIGVSSRTVERARQVIDSGKDAVIAAVRSGDKTIHKAATEVAKPKRKRKEEKDAGKAADRAVKQLNKIADDLKHYGNVFEDIRGKLDGLAAEIEAKATEIEKSNSSAAS